MLTCACVSVYTGGAPRISAALSRGLFNGVCLVCLIVLSFDNVRVRSPAYRTSPVYRGVFFRFDFPPSLLLNAVIPSLYN